MAAEGRRINILYDDGEYGWADYPDEGLELKEDLPELAQAQSDPDAAKQAAAAQIAVHHVQLEADRVAVYRQKSAALVRGAWEAVHPADGSPYSIHRATQQYASPGLHGVAV